MFRTSLRFGFAVAPVVLMVVICLSLTAGAAAASGVNLRSFAGDVVDSLVEPLPLAPPPPLLEPKGHKTRLAARPSEEGAAGRRLPARGERRADSE